MKWLVFKHYLFRSLKEPIGIGIVTGLPTVLIIIMTMVFTGTMDESTEYMVNGYNMVATSMAVMFMVMFQFFGGNVLLDYIHPDFRGDRRWRIFSMPLKTNDYVFGVLSACFLYCVIQGTIVIGISTIFLDAYWGNPFILVATLFACAGLAQLLFMLLFLLFPKKSTVEGVAQCIIWGMLLLSNYIGTVSGGNAGQFNHPVLKFLSSYGTPISLANRAITNSGFVGNNMNNALLCLGILYALLAVFATIVILAGKKKGFSPSKSVFAASAPVTMPKKENIWKRVENLGNIGTEAKPQDKAVNTMPQDLILISPTARRRQFTIFKFALLRALRSPVSLVFNAILPLILILIPGLWSGEAPGGFSFIGVAIMYGSFMAARGILNDKLDGTFTRIFTSPVTTFQYLSQNLMAVMTPLTVQILSVGIIGSILYQWKTGFTLSLMLIYFLFAVASVAFSYAWSCLFKEKELSYAIFSVLMSVVAMLGGFFIPLSILPELLRYIGALFPAFWLSNGILYLQDGGVMGSYWVSVVIIAMFSVLFMVFGSKRRVV